MAENKMDGIKMADNDSEWLRANDYLNDLLTGEAEIVEAKHDKSRR